MWVVGSARDVSFLTDFLPSYLFPYGENKVVEWGVVGISLGGHSAWLSMRHGTSNPSLHP